MRRCCNGNTTVLYEGKPVGTPDAGAFWRVIASTACARCSPRRRRSAPSAARIPTAPSSATTTSRGFAHPVPRRRARRSRHDQMGGNAAQSAGDRSLVADGDRLVDLRQLRRARPPAGEVRLAHQAGAGLGRCAVLDEDRQASCRPGRSARSAPSCRCRRAPADPVERRRPLPQILSRRLSRLLPDRRRGLSSTTTATVTSWRRTDDVINVAGHRLSTGAMEEVLADHRDVAECAVIGVADPIKGQLPLGLLVLKAGVDRAARRRSCKEAVQTVRERIGPVAAFKTAVVAKRLPKTRSGKILRGTMQKIADSEAWQHARRPSTIPPSSTRSAKRSPAWATPRRASSRIDPKNAKGRCDHRPSVVACLREGQAAATCLSSFAGLAPTRSGLPPNTAG